MYADCDEVIVLYNIIIIIITLTHVNCTRVNTEKTKIGMLEKNLKKIK